MDLIQTIVTSALIAGIVGGILARWLKVSEFRQAWINDLRKDVADYIGLARKWYRAYEECNGAALEERAAIEKEKVFPIATDAFVVLWRIRLRMNPRKNRYLREDEALLKSLLDLIDPGKFAISGPGLSWQEAADRAVDQAREILKREWEVTKRFPPFDVGQRKTPGPV